MSRRRGVALSVAALLFLTAATGLYLRRQTARADESHFPSIAEPREVADWARKNAILLKGVVPGIGFEDMEPLRKLIGSARIVALGEATHGTREFFQFKHRMFEFLAERMGFTVFGIEANWPESLAIDDYVVNGRGDPAEALARLGFWTWNTEEVLDLIRWMRAYNERRDHRSKLHFFGFDAQWPVAAASTLRNFLSRVEPEYAAAADGALEALQQIGYASDRSELQAACVKARDVVAGLEPRLVRCRRDYETRSSRSEWLIARRSAQVLEQVVEIFSEWRRGGRSLRDRFMAENIRWIAEDQGPDTRMMVWAHNAHVSRVSGMMGSDLAHMFNRDFVNLGFAFGQGGFQARDDTLAGNHSGSLKSFTVGPPPAESLDALWLSIREPLFVLDLRRASGPVANFLKGYRVTREIGAGFSGERSMESAECLPERYDGLIFVANTTAACPLAPPVWAGKP